MSLAGLVEFSETIKKLQKSERWNKKMLECEKLEILSILLKGDYNSLKLNNEKKN